MKKLIITAFAALLMFSLFPVQVNASGKREKSTTSTTKSENTQYYNASAFYTGDGGKGMSLAILIPSASGLAKEQDYLPTMVQGVLVGDIAKYSGIRVLDRQTLEKTLKETESGIYKNEADYGQLGEIANVDYALTGSIAKTGSGYAMQIQVVGTGKNNIGVTKASYSGSCTIAELDNFTGIRKASMELLTQMGVVLTDSGKQALSRAGRENYVNAQTALAQGIVAQRNGNTIESLAKFYQANSYDPSFAEAATRVNTLSATIRTGSNIEDIRNDIAWRNEWKKLLQEGQEWFKKQPKPIEYIEYDDISRYTRLVYDPELSYTVDYINDTITYTYNVMIERLTFQRPSPPAYIKKVEADLRTGLEATGRNGDWKLSVGRYDWDIHATQPVHHYHVNNVGGFLEQVDVVKDELVKDLVYLYTADLYNDKGKKLKSNCFFVVTKNQNNTVNFTPIRGTLRNNTTMLTDLKTTMFLTDKPEKNSRQSYNPREQRYEIFPVVNISISQGILNNIDLDKMYVEYKSSKDAHASNNDTYYMNGKFSNINVDDVTDTMTIKITNIYEFEEITDKEIVSVFGSQIEYSYKTFLKLLRQGTDIISVNTGKVYPDEKKTIFYCYEY